MNDIFGFLTAEQWLAILSIGVGLWWLKSVLHKPLRKFVSGQMINWTVALAGVRPKDITINAAYQCEQGQNWNMLIVEIVLLIMAAGSVWSLDSVLGLFV